MDTTISINSSFQEIHPITEKLLNGQLKLEDITLSQFTKGRKIYNSRRECKCKGFEAEHLISVKLQMELYNKENNTFYFNRELFEKEVGLLDDRCYRVTPFEHIVMHFLKAKENPNEISIFESMVRFNWNKLNTENKNLLENLVEFSKLREEGLKRMASSKKGKPSCNKGKKLNFSEEGKRRLKESHIGNKNHLGHKCSKEQRKRISDAHLGLPAWNKGIPCKEDVKEKISKTLKGKPQGHWYINKITLKLTKAFECPGENWILGRKIKGEE